MMNDSVVRELVRAAKRRGIRPEALCALVEIETAGIPFENDNNTPRLLYERHIAYREAQKKGVLNQFVNAGLAIPKWNKATQYKDQGSSAKRIALITRARAIDENVANRSASWGLGQTMGFLAEEQGFTDATEMVDHMTGSIPGQIDCMLRELTRKKLIQPLNNRQYVQVAKVYNGPGYAQNSYDTKLADADKRWARRLANTPLDRAPPPEQRMSRSAIRALQTQLKNLGYAEVGRVDGFWGSRTVGALSAFQAHEGLPVTGTYDEATQAAMAEAVKRPVSPARKDITADELKEEGSRTIATADNLSMFGKAKLWLAGVTGGGAIIDWISDGTMDTVQGVWDRVSKIPISFILFIVFLVVSGLVVMYVAEKIKSYKVEDYASGRLS